MSDYAAIEKEARIFTEECVTNNRIDPTLFAQYDIKRGLRDKIGKGVLAGITNISRIDAFEERRPEGSLRGQALVPRLQRL